MPKLKTSKSAAKRFSFTGSGKIKHKNAFARHKLEAKNIARRRRLRKLGFVHETNARAIARLLPYKN